MKSQSFMMIICCLFFIGCSALIYYTVPNSEAHQEIDSSEYDLVARVYAQTGKLVHPEFGRPVHPIGYYWFLGFMYSLVGDNQVYIFIIQCLLSLLCFLIVYKLALLLCGPSTALVALVFASCNIGFLVYSQLILAEILLTICLTLFVYAFVCFVLGQRFLHLFFAALFLCFSVLVKPAALYYNLVLAFFVWFATTGKIRSKIINCCLFLVVFYTPLVGYMCYNHYMFNEFVITTLHSGNLFEYFLPRRILPRLEPAVSKEITAYIDSSASLEERSQRSKKIFFDLLHQHPLVFCSALTESMVKVFFGLYATQLKVMYNSALKEGKCSYFMMPGKTSLERLYRYATFGTTSNLLKSIALIELLWLIISYFLMCCAFIVLLYSKNYYWLLLCGSYIGYFDLVAAFDGCGRYRMMLEPVLIVVAAYACRELYVLLQKSFSKKHIQTEGVVL